MIFLSLRPDLCFFFHYGTPGWSKKPLLPSSTCALPPLVAHVPSEWYKRLEFPCPDRSIESKDGPNSAYDRTKRMKMVIGLCPLAMKGCLCLRHPDYLKYPEPKWFSVRDSGLQTSRRSLYHCCRFRPHFCEISLPIATG